MLDDISYIKQSLELNLFALRSIREYAINIELSFYSDADQNYQQRARALRENSQALGREYVILTNGKVSNAVIDYQFVVTDYTLPAELLTEKLFNIDIDTTVTTEELNFERGDIINKDEQTPSRISALNQQSIQIMNDFIELSNEIKGKLESNNLFSYTYPSLYEFMISQVIRLRENLNKIELRDLSDPTFVTRQEYELVDTVYSIAQFLRGLIDPGEAKYISEIEYFVLGLPKLLKDYQDLPLTPDNQIMLTNRSIEAIKRLRELFRNMLQDLLDAKLYFIVEATAIDNFYTDVNYIYYRLVNNANYQNTYSMN